MKKMFSFRKKLKWFTIFYLPDLQKFKNVIKPSRASHRSISSFPLPWPGVQTPFISHLDCFLKSPSPISSPLSQFFTMLSQYYLYKMKHVAEWGFALVWFFIQTPITKNHRPLLRAIEPAGTPSQDWLKSDQMGLRSHFQHCFQRMCTEDWSSLSY